MTKKTYQIKGMHCRSCEILIEDELLKIHGVKQVTVNHATGTAEICFRNTLSENAVEKAVSTAGYSLGTDKTRFLSKNLNDYKELGMAFLVVMILYLVAKSFGIFDLSNTVKGDYSSLGIVFVIGLTAGISTCMALVGGLVLGAAAKYSQTHPNATKLEKFTPHLFFNLGRIGAYVVFGGIIGLIGSFFQLSTSILGLLTLAVGAVMLLMGGQLIEIFPFLKKISFTLPKSISRTLGVKEQNPAMMGAMTFFLPCGFTQAMQLYAMSTGSPVTGALTMGVFALGTAPGLLGVGGLTSIIKGAAAKLFFKTAGVVVILLAVYNISNGLNLLGFSPVQVLGADTSTNKDLTDPNVTVVNGVQEVRMRQVGGGYVPNKFTIRKGLPVKWIITSENSYSCATSLVSQQLGIRQGLQPGENIINFDPTQTGTIRFSCSMGMYRGTFNVID